MLHLCLPKMILQQQSNTVSTCKIQVPGVPNIRAHMQKRIDKAKELDQVLEMHRG